MKKSSKQRLFTMLLILGVICLVTACNGKKESNTNKQEEQDSDQATVRSEVKIWYLWGGKEGEVIERVIERFNNSQEQYLAVGLSVPDEQKIKVAIAGGDGPDVTDSFSSNVGLYAREGISLPLDKWIERDQFDLADFVPSALAQTYYMDELHALPMNVMLNSLYYNKTILAAAGYDAPPETSEQLLEIAMATTKTLDDGSIDTLGFPAYPGFPFSDLMYAFGGEFFTEDYKNTAFDQPAALEAFRSLHKYNTEFGIDNIKQLQAAGKWLDPTDLFLAGKQALRIDGAWLSGYIQNSENPVDYGIAPLPYLASDSATKGSGMTTNSTFYITRTANNPEGAWEFMKFLFSPEELAYVNREFVNIPSQFTAMNHEKMDDFPDISLFREFLKSDNLKPYPNIPEMIDFTTTILNPEVENVVNLRKTPEEAIETIQQKSAELLQ